MTALPVRPANPPPGMQLLVSTGTRGIGHAAADAYVARGARVCVPARVCILARGCILARVCILDRDPVPNTPSGWTCVQGSVADAAGIERAYAEMDRAWGGVDVAHANAGKSANKPSLGLTGGN